MRRLASSIQIIEDANAEFKVIACGRYASRILCRRTCTIYVDARYVMDGRTGRQRDDMRAQHRGMHWGY